MLVRVQPGETARTSVVIDNPLAQPETLRLRLDHGSITSPWSREIIVPANGTARVDLTLTVFDQLPGGRHLVPLIVNSNEVEDGGVFLLAARAPR